jgi:DNA primase
MEHEGMSYVEALRYLAKNMVSRSRKTLSARTNCVEKSDRDSLYIVMNYAKDYYKELLQETEEGRSIGMSYFRERGFNTRTIDKFELGYSINEWDHFHKKQPAAGYSERDD